MRRLTILMAFLLMLCSSMLHAQGVQIKGKVSSSEDGSALPGASVVVKGTSVAVVTDADGNYSLNLPSGATSLMVSFIGMKTQEVQIGGQTVLDITLLPDVVDLDEVVVTAMGIKRDRKALSYSVQEIKSDELGKSGSNNLITSLQGKVAGVEVRQSSGMPGSSSQMMIRGARSLTGNNQPLYVIDGMPIESASDFSVGSNGVSGSDFSARSIDLDPKDIESISVLKGPTAAALYGLRASNGVVIITTKSGKGIISNKPQITYTTDYVIDQIAQLPEKQEKYAQGSYGSYSPTTSMSWGPIISELSNDPKYGGNAATTTYPGKEAGKYWFPQEQKWVTPALYKDNTKDFFKQGATFSNNLSVAQNSNNGNYSISLGSTDQKGIIPNTGMTRYNARGNAEIKLTEKWSTGFSSNFSNVNIDKMAGGSNLSTPMFTVYSLPPSYDLTNAPNHSELDPYAQIHFRGARDNPYWSVENNKFTENTKRFFGNFFTDYNAFDWLKFRYQLGVDVYSTDGKDLYNLGSAETGGFNSQGYVAGVTPGGGQLNDYSVSKRQLNSNLSFTISKKIGDEINLQFVGGNEFNDMNANFYSITGSNMVVGGIDNIVNFNTITSENTIDRSRSVGFYGNLSADYKSMLFFNATGRNDVVSNMPRGNRSFFYPSVGLGFVFTELSGLKDNPILSFGKIRASYAQVGQVGRLFVQGNSYVSGSSSSGFLSSTDGIQYPFNGLKTYSPSTTLIDPNLKPQNTNTYEIGTELYFLNRRIGIDYTYSYQNVTDQIFDVPLSPSTGYRQFLRNAGKVETTGHELTLTLVPLKTTDLEWVITANYSKYDNKVVNLEKGVSNLFLGGFETPSVRAFAGQTYPVIYGVAYARDKNGNLIIDDSGSTDENADNYNPDYGMPMAGKDTVLGKISPDYQISISSSFRYKSLKFSFLIDMKQGNKMYSGTNRLLLFYGTDKRTEERTTPFVVKGVKASNGATNDINVSDYQEYYSVLSNIDEAAVYDASYIKLREVSISYTLPKTWTKYAEITVSAVGRNLFTKTDFPNLDPESSQGNGNMSGGIEYFSLPQTKSYGVGLNVVF